MHRNCIGAGSGGPGEIIFTRTIDGDGMDEKSELRSRPVNPLTGPFYVREPSRATP